MNLIVSALERYLREVRVHVLDMARQGRGREVLGGVPGRSLAEDVEIGLDRSCQDILERRLRQTGLRIDILSEHGLVHLGEEGDTPEYLVCTDPFDGSGLYSRGLRADWWSVTTVLRATDLTVVAGGAVDILRGELYLADKAEVTVQAADGGDVKVVQPSTRTALNDDAILATYLLSPLYLREWMARARGFVETISRRWPGVMLWANGGSQIYAWLARGTVDAYVMFNEPRSEIDPGLGIARASGIQMFSVEEGGGLEPYIFAPGRGTERVPFYIAACTSELAEQIAAEIPA